MRRFYLYLREHLREVIPEGLLEKLPRRCRIIGDVGVLKLEPELEGYKGEIGKLALDFYDVRSVVLMRQIRGRFRTPDAEVIAGSKNTVTIHKEHNYRFKLDVLKLMLCLGNSNERYRMAKVSNRSEIVIDMFAGIGQFSIPMALNSRPRKIFSIEINEEAYYYLIENILLNRVQDIVFPIHGDSKIILDRYFEDFADRIIMGYFGGTMNFLKEAFKAIKLGGVIHFHELYERWNALENCKEDIKREAEKYGVKVSFIYGNVVKSYSSRRVHVVVDFKVESK
ncbi:MAG: class I SAM-dependent methyltransferase family protein [Candidatus Odinarchaeota archaeon]|nr:class I SAM-dependent methyltransferase family protein [Candidatus Odinarchaeota archaeon]